MCVLNHAYNSEQFYERLDVPLITPIYIFEAVSAEEGFKIGVKILVKISTAYSLNHRCQKGLVNFHNCEP